MHLHKLGAAHAERVVAVLEDLLARARAGELTSLAYLAEQSHTREPLAGISGRYREDPAKAVAELAIMNVRLTNYAASLRQDFTASTI